MSTGQPTSEEGFPSTEQVMGFSFLIIRAWAMSAEVFIRHSMGARYPGLVAPFVFVLVPVYCLFWQHDDPMPLMWFLLVYLAMCAVHRVSALKRMFQGDQIHTYYNGTPLLLKLFPKHDEIAIKAILEPALVVLVALFLGAFSKPLCVYLLIAATCLCATTLISEHIDRTRILDMSDQVAEQQHVAEEFRRRHR